MCRAGAFAITAQNRSTKHRNVCMSPGFSAATPSPSSSASARVVASSSSSRCSSSARDADAVGSASASRAAGTTRSCSVWHSCNVSRTNASYVARARVSETRLRLAPDSPPRVRCVHRSTYLGQSGSGAARNAALSMGSGGATRSDSATSDLEMDPRTPASVVRPPRNASASNASASRARVSSRARSPATK